MSEYHVLAVNRRDKKVAMPACLAKIAAMASSSKGRRASSSKKTSAGTARVISVKRTDALPRKGSGPTARRKPVVQPPIDAPTKPPATAVAGSSKKAHSVPQTKGNASRTKPTRATGRRAARKLNKLKTSAAVEAVIAPAVEPVIVAALEPVAETGGAADPGTTANEVSAMTPVDAPEVEALPFFETEVEVDTSAIVEETAIVDAAFARPAEAVTFPSNAIEPRPVFRDAATVPLARTAVASPAPATPARHEGKRTVVTVVSQLLSTLRRWTGVR